MESHTNSNQSKDRKTIEKNRRVEMKSLYSKLNSLLPRDHHQISRESLSVPDQLDEAAKYIKKLQVNVEKKRERKRKLITITNSEKFKFSSSTGSSSNFDMVVPRRLPRIEIQEMGLILHVFLVTSLEHKFMFQEIIHVLVEELGVEINHAGYSILDDTIFHTLHCKVEECDYGVNTRISERLRKLVNNVN